MSTAPPAVEMGVDPTETFRPTITTTITTATARHRLRILIPIPTPPLLLLPLLLLVWRSIIFCLAKFMSIRFGLNTKSERHCSGTMCSSIWRCRFIFFIFSLFPPLFLLPLPFPPTTPVPPPPPLPPFTLSHFLVFNPSILISLSSAIVSLGVRLSA